MPNASETGHLIAGAEISGTTVVNKAGETIGALQDVMIDKATGRVAYAILSFGGFLGLGERLHAIPWALLKYDRAWGVYVADLSPSQLAAAPPYQGAESHWDSESEAQLHMYFDTGPL